MSLLLARISQAHRAAMSGGSGVLDSLSASAVAAFSLRKLVSTYTGPAIKVRRSSDNSEADIGFNASGYVDETSLLAFTGAGNAYVSVFYDQTTNAHNAVQTTAIMQPAIVVAGAVVYASGKPSLKFYDATNGLSRLLATANVFSSGFAVNAVVLAGTGNYAQIADKTDSNGIAKPWMLFAFSSKWQRFYLGNGASQNYIAPTAAVGAFQVITYQANASTLFAELFNNGASTGSGAISATYIDGTSPIAIGARSDSADYLDGNLSEIVFFASPLSTADRHLIERDQGTFYGVTVA